VRKLNQYGEFRPTQWPGVSFDSFLMKFKVGS